MSAFAPSRLLSEDIRPLALRLALPSLAAMLFSGLSTLLDALFLSRSGGALFAAVGLCFPLVTLIQTIGFTLGMGAGCFISRELGARASSAPARQAASSALFVSLFLGGALCLVGFLSPGGLLRLLGAKDDLLAAAIPYARYLLCSAPLTCMSLVLGSLLRAQGFAAPGPAAYGAGALAGTGLCFLLLSRFSFGVHGAGIALLAREGVVFFVFLLYMLRLRGALRVSIGDVSISPRVFLSIMRSGLPTLVRQGLSSVSGVVLARELALAGDYAVSGMGLTLRVVNLVSSGVIGFSQGFAPVCGANFGAGKMDRVQKAYRLCLRLTITALLALGALVYFSSAPLFARFAPDAASAAFGSAALRAQSAVFFAQGAVILMNMLTQSMGLPLRATLIAASRQGYVLLPLLLILPRVFGPWGIIYAQPVSDLISLFIGWALIHFTDFSCAPCGCCGARKGSR